MTPAKAKLYPRSETTGISGSAIGISVTATQNIAVLKASDTLKDQGRTKQGIGNPWTGRTLRVEDVF